LGDLVEEILPGDVISKFLRENQWQDPSPTAAMTSIAIQEYPDGRAADRLEKVSNEQ
jgi:hypothetical protein